MKLRQIAPPLIMFTLGIVFAAVTLQTGTPPPAPRPPFFDSRLMSGEPPLPIPPLSAIIGDAATDADALSAVANFYERHRVKLAAVFRETNDERTRALFGMYIIHLAVPYNTVDWDYQRATLLEFVNAGTAHCGAYAVAQSHVYTALGLRWRNVIVDNGWHGLIEAEISGNYEVFDSTSAVWINQPVERILQGVERHYRAYYTPALDANADPVYRAHLQAGYSVPELRAGLPLWGLYVFPHRIEIIAASG